MSDTPYRIRIVHAPSNLIFKWKVYLEHYVPGVRLWRISDICGSYGIWNVTSKRAAIRLGKKLLRKAHRITRESDIIIDEDLNIDVVEGEE